MKTKIDRIFFLLAMERISLEEAKSQVLNLFNVSKSATIKSSGDFRDDDNRESQSEYFGRK